jgi:Nucleotidyl transferase AbiEii toxin, Type IV TA system
MRKNWRRGFGDPEGQARFSVGDPMVMNPRLRSARGLPGIPEWEATKGNSRPLGHPEAVAECAELSDQYRRMWRRGTAGMVELNSIVQTLRAKKVPFVLTGAHGISGWTGRPRATKDVDILVKSGRNYARAVNALRALYPSLEIRQFAGVTGFFLPGEKESVIDVTYPHRPDLQETLQTAIWVEEGGNRYRVPALEAALANKYGAMLTLNRDPGKRGQDAVDFFYMVRHAAEEGRQPIDLEKLRDLGEKVWPGGGGAEILRLIEEVKEGRVPNVNPPGEPRR